MKRGLKEFQKLYDLACESNGLALDLAQDLCFRLEGAKDKSICEEDVHMAYGLSGMGRKYEIPLMDQVHKLAKALGYTAEDYIENMKKVSTKQQLKNREWSKVKKEKMKNPYCERCGSTYLLDAHHRNRNRNDNTIENCEILCRVCHRNLHDGVL